MALLGDLVVKIVGDTADFVREIDKSYRKMTDFEKDMRRITKAMGQLGMQMTKFVTLPVLGIGAAFVKAASDAEETNSKFDAVFKDQSEAVREWAAEFSDAVGRSTTENLGFLATIQDTLVPLGLQRDAAAEMSKATVALATDLASFNNLPTEQVVRDIQSAIVGNTETLRKYGVVANQAEIIQEAMNLGLIDTASELNATSKAQAIYSLLVKGTADAQGDAVRTAGSTANQFRALKAEVIDLAISFGNQLLPFVNKMIEGARGLVSWFTDLDTRTKQIIVRVAGFAAAAGPLLIILSKLPAVITGISAAMKLLASPPAGAIIVAVAAAVALTNAIVQLIRRKREYERIIYADVNAVNALTQAQLEQRKGELEELRTGIHEKLTALTEAQRERQQRLNEMVDEFGLRGASMRTEYGQLRATMEGANQTIDAQAKLLADTDAALVTVNRALSQTTDELAANQDAFDETTTSAAEFTEGIGEADDAVFDLLEHMGLLRGHIDTVGFTIGEDLTPAVEENAEAWTGWEEETTGAFVSVRNAMARLNQNIIDDLEEVTATGVSLWAQYAQDAQEQLLLGFSGFRDADKQQTESHALDVLDIWGQFFSKLFGIASDSNEKAAKAQKIIEIFRATIAGLRATIEALPNVPLSIATAALAAANVAAIIAQPIPKFAQGGIVTAPTQALIGEGGQPEIVLPLDQLGDLLSSRGDFSDVAGGASHVVVNLDGVTILDYIGRASRDGRVLIDARALV